MTNEELVRLMSPQGAAEVSETIRKLAALLEKFRRGQVVAGMFGGREDASFGDSIRAIDDDGFLRDLEHFGDALMKAARAQRSKAEVRRMGGGYSRGA